MELVMIEQEKHRVKFILKGEEHSFCDVLRKEIWQGKDVDISGYHVAHPQVSEPSFVVQTKKTDVNTVVLDAAERLHATATELKKSFQSF